MYPRAQPFQQPFTILNVSSLPVTLHVGTSQQSRKYPLAAWFFIRLHHHHGGRVIKIQILLESPHSLRIAWRYRPVLMADISSFMMNMQPK